MTDTRDKLPSRPSSIGQAHRIIVQLKARIDELDELRQHFEEKFTEQCQLNLKANKRIDEYRLERNRHTNDITALESKVDKQQSEITEQVRFITKLCALLDYIEVEEDSELARGRFDIFKEHGTVEWGMPISGEKQ